MITAKLVSLATILFLAGSPALAPAAAGPEELVRITVDAVVAVLQDQSLPKEAKRREITRLVRSRFDFQTMSRGVLAVNWRSATSEERRRFVELFSELLEATYRGRMEAYIDQYSDERVEYLGETVEGRRAVVDTMVVTKTARIPVSYKMVAAREGEWRVYDVVVEGVSLVRNYRSSFGEIVRNKGMEGLLARMEEKIVELRSAPPEARDR